MNHFSRFPITFAAATLILAAFYFSGCTTAPVAAKPTVATGPDPRFEVPVPENPGVPGAGPITRGDWFRKLWRERRAAFAGAVTRDQGAVVFLGDSITHGWGDDLGGSFPGLKVANRGIGGDTTRGVLFRLAGDVVALHPRGVVLLIGTNDLQQGADPVVVTGNLRLILGELHRANPMMPVVLCAVLPSSAKVQRPPDLIQRLNRLYAAAVKDEPHVTLVNTWQLFADAQGNAPADEFPDLLHPNTKGYARLAGGLRPVLAGLGFIGAKAD